jgi:hypothetical protein
VKSELRVNCPRRPIASSTGSSKPALRHTGGRPPAQVIADLDEFPVRVPHIDAEQSADCSCAFHGCLLDGHAVSVEFGPDVLTWVVRDEADVGAARDRSPRLGFELLADLMKVDLAPPEGWLTRMSRTVVTSLR